MAATTQLSRIADLSDADLATISALAQAVYPPAEAAAWPGRRLEWSPHEWCVRVWAEDGSLASYVGLVLRDATYDGRPVRVGGIGGVKTHPAARRRGHAGHGIRRALEFFREQPDVAFALLVCEPRLLAYYGGLGWREFAGRLVVRQRGREEDFTFNRVMTCGVRLPGPASGTIDLCGPPW